MTEEKVAVIIGGNSYLGVNIAIRLLEKESPETNFTLVISSRTQARADEAIKNIEDKLKLLPERSGTLKFDTLLLDLTSMENIKKNADYLSKTYEKINYLYMNAALGLCDGIDWFAAIWEVLTNPVKAMTDPDYRIQRVGLISDDNMGYIFQANVFGAYYLMQHILSPLSEGKAIVVWISSLCSTSKYLSLDDIELIESKRPYDGSKRLVDLLHLATYKQLKQLGIYQYVVQPGIFISQSFANQMNIFTYYSMLLMFHFARYWGSYWHNIDGYKAANSAVYVTTFIDKDFERQDMKYGSATFNDGTEYVKAEEIDPLGKDKVYKYISEKAKKWDEKFIREKYDLDK